MSPETNTDPIAPAPNNTRTKLFVALAAGVLIIIFAIIGFLLLTGDPNSPTGASRTPTFKNWLKPASEIKVGAHRYSSPCQVLPKQTVESAFGKLSDKTVIQEKYLDQTVKESDQPLMLSCVYNHGLGTGQDVSLETEQYTDATEVKNVSFSLGSFDNEEVEANIAAFKKASDASNNQATKDFVTKLERSYATFKQYRDEHDDAKLASVDVNSLVLPVSGSITGALNDFVFVGAYNNVTYVLGHTPSSNKGDLSKYSDAELVSELAAMKKATEAVATNLGNESLDQSPAPTILGTTDKYGSTTILEPCAILSPDTFSQITGKQQSKPVDRTTASINFTTKRTTQQDKQLILPSNKCSRQASVAVGSIGSDDTYATLDVRYGSSTKQAEQWLHDNFKMEAGDITLQTNADWAVSFVNPVNSGDARIIAFRVGANIGIIDIYTRPDSGDEVEATQDQYVQAINILTPRIKQAIADAEK